MRVVVTGGGGFLGSCIARKLHERGDQVTVLGRRRYAQFDHSGIESIACDIRDKEGVSSALEGFDTVFHAAALPGVWGDYEKYHSINFEGTLNVIEACRENAVKKLIFTSSPSVVFGESDMENADESAPYPASYLCHYPETKAQAEQLVIKANDIDGLSTVALRPHLIWGVGDPHLVPRILNRAMKGKLVKVGDGKNRVDIIHVENAAHAHIQACDALAPGSKVAGQCYFISDDEPVNLWDWIDDLLKALEYPAVERTISYNTARFVGAALETIYRALKIKKEPPMTRFVAAQLATSHYFNIAKAKKDFGYHPVVSQKEGMKAMVSHLRTHPVPLAD